MKKYLALFFLTGIIFGSNGKITGTVSQKTNGEPAVGVNIILVDSYMGAATDENGRFTILNVPPGTYSLRADAIGFAQVLVQNVRVTTSQTTELSIKLEESVVEGQEVTVVPRASLLVLFPAWMSHMVTPLTKKENRYSISFACNYHNG